jgi:hypothetical protein
MKRILILTANLQSTETDALAGDKKTASWLIAATPRYIPEHCGSELTQCSVEAQS